MATIRTSIENARGCGYRKGGGLYLVTPGGGVPCGRLPHVLETCPTCGAGIKPTRGWTWINPKMLFGDKPCDPRAGGDCSLCPLAPEQIMERAGLLWIGEKFYPTPEDWLQESASMGVSRRIKAVPRGFVVGETYVFAAHRKVYPKYASNDILVEETSVLPTRIRNGNAKCSEACPGLPENHLPGDKCLIYDEPIHNTYTRCESCIAGLRPMVHLLPAIFHVFKPTAVEYVVEGNETEEELDALEKRGLSLVKVVPNIKQVDPEVH